ncbi:ATP-dependent Zn protease [Rhizobium sp. PP-F2F-G36]|nr:ATP-dependent Zn protease [Rhizobium sp. PP-F2F-G36]
MRKRYPFDPALKDLVYLFLMREAVRKAGLLRNPRTSTTVFWLHPELSADHAATVLERLILDGEDRFNVTKIEQSTRGKIDFSKTKMLLSEKRSLAIVAQADELPSFLVAAADNVVEVDLIAPRHLCGALRAGHGIAATTRQAEALLGFPADSMFSALRPDRPAEVALAKLDAARVRTDEKDRDTAVLTLNDLSGFGHAKTWGLELAKDIADWRAGRITWSDIDAGILLSGPPGTGKTLFASALAKTCEAHFLPTSLAQWQSKGHLGDLLKAMRADFATATRQSPCVMLIDEFDSIGSRSQFVGHHQQYSTEVVNALLECLDGSSRLEGVVVIGACNDPARIDPALLRSGRLSARFTIGLPDRDERLRIIEMLVGTRLQKSVLAEISDATEGFTGADLAKLVRVARRSARRRGKPVASEDFQAAISPAIPIDGLHRQVISVHEAGHAVVGTILRVGVLVGITIASEYRRNNPTPQGTTIFVEQPQGFMSRQSYLDKITMLLAGMAAEEMVLGNITSGSGGAPGSDLQRAADLATQMEIQFGMGDALGHLYADSSEQLDALRRSNSVIQERVERLLGGQMDRARAILNENRAALEKIASEACAEGAISGVKVSQLIALAVPHD